MKVFTLNSFQILWNQKLNLHPIPSILNEGPGTQRGKHIVATAKNDKMRAGSDWKLPSRARPREDSQVEEKETHIPFTASPSALLQGVIKIITSICI